jgi:ribonuclease HI
MTQRLRLFFDGGCRPNPGPMESAVVTRGVVYFRHDLGIGDNNDAEWLALLHALDIAEALGADELELLGDSAYVVAHARGGKTCRRGHLTRFRSRAEAFAKIRVRQVPRSHNLAGIALDCARDRV